MFSNLNFPLATSLKRVPVSGLDKSLLGRVEYYYLLIIYLM